jgi:hypothetical protein
VGEAVTASVWELVFRRHVCPWEHSGSWGVRRSSLVRRFESDCPSVWPRTWNEQVENLRFVGLWRGSSGPRSFCRHLKICFRPTWIQSIARQFLWRPSKNHDLSRLISPLFSPAWLAVVAIPWLYGHHPGEWGDP